MTGRSRWTAVEPTGDPDRRRPITEEEAAATGSTSGTCDARLDLGIGVELFACVLPPFHDGMHRTEDGDLWGTP
ncbi:hypothetical protein [Euzebya rosea]|uniref:hypothetical protein n=1 Tax=Euzebya rosea TaxID=2052804 RepID=UPI000D3E8187|nr:hypothetical protein [Euzebya rosea]